MKRFLVFLAAMLLSGLAFADSAIFRSGKDSVRITENPCHPAVVALLPAEVIQHFRAAEAAIGGKLLLACWALRADGIVHLVYQDGDEGLVPGHLFKHNPGV